MRSPTASKPRLGSWFVVNVAAAVALAFIGAGVALAVGSSTSTVSVCATSPAQTISDNGSPIATIPSAIACATTTYTIPTVTTTVTGPTTTSISSPTFSSETAYTKTRPAFTPTRTISVSGAAALKAAISNLQPGDLVKATSSFTVAGETIIAKRLSSAAVLDLTGVSFVYSGTSNLPAVWLNNSSHLQIYGGDLSTSDAGGSCLLDYGSQDVLWWGFSLHDCGGSGLAVFTTGAAVDRLDLEGTVTKVGQNLAWDPHAEKGTGLHGAILWDAGTTYPFTNTRIALDEHDIPVGACVEIGNSAAAVASGNSLILRCVNETEVSTTQTGGNGLQLWGDTSSLDLDVQYIEVDNAQGRALEAGGVYSGQRLSGVTVEYGRASLTNQNAALDGGARPGVRWDTVGAPTYRNVAPLP